MFLVLACKQEDGDAIPILCCIGWIDKIPYGVTSRECFTTSVLNLLRDGDDSLTTIESILAKDNDDMIGIVLANVDAIIEECYVEDALESTGNLLKVWLTEALDREVKQKCPKSS